MATFFFIVGAYLYGSIPLVWYIARLKGYDLRRYGSGNVGGGNLAIATGFWPGFIGSVWDFSKGIIPILCGHYLLGLSLGALCLAGVAALAGQMWSVWTGFYGGRGVSVSLAIVLIFFSLSFITWMVLLAFVPFIIAVVVRSIIADSKKTKAQTRIVPLCALLSFALVPIVASLSGDSYVITVTFSFILLLLVIRRLTADIDSALKERTDKEKVRDVLINRLLYDRNHLAVTSASGQYTEKSGARVKNR